MCGVHEHGRTFAERSQIEQSWPNARGPVAGGGTTGNPPSFLQSVGVDRTPPHVFGVAGHLLAGRNAGAATKREHVARRGDGPRAARRSILTCPFTPRTLATAEALMTKP